MVQTEQLKAIPIPTHRVRAAPDYVLLPIATMQTAYVAGAAAVAAADTADAVVASTSTPNTASASASASEPDTDTMPDNENELAAFSARTTYTTQPFDNATFVGMRSGTDSESDDFDDANGTWDATALHEQSKNPMKIDRCSDPFDSNEKSNEDDEATTTTTTTSSTTTATSTLTSTTSTTTTVSTTKRITRNAAFLKRFEAAPLTRERQNSITSKAEKLRNQYNAITKIDSTTTPKPSPQKPRFAIKRNPNQVRGGKAAVSAPTAMASAAERPHVLLNTADDCGGCKSKHRVHTCARSSASTPVAPTGIASESALRDLKPGQVQDDPELQRRMYKPHCGPHIYETVQQIARKFGATPRQLMHDNWGRFPDLRVHSQFKKGTFVILPLDPATWKEESDDAEVEYCICGGGDFGKMFRCDDCKEWFHDTCLQLTKDALKEIYYAFNCKMCTEYNVSLRWPPEVEAALISAITNIFGDAPAVKGRSSINTNCPHRNQQIADLIFRDSGQIVSALQIKHRLKRKGGLPTGLANLSSMVQQKPQREETSVKPEKPSVQQGASNTEIDDEENASLVLQKVKRKTRKHGEQNQVALKAHSTDSDDFSSTLSANVSTSCAPAGDDTAGAIVPMSKSSQRRAPPVADDDAADQANREDALPQPMRTNEEVVETIKEKKAAIATATVAGVKRSRSRSSSSGAGHNSSRLGSSGVGCSIDHRPQHSKEKKKKKRRRQHVGTDVGSWTITKVTHQLRACKCGAQKKPEDWELFCTECGQKL
jgi:hypothetical protein